MKKIIFFIVLSFIFIFNVNAYNNFHLGERVPDLFIKTVKGDNSHIDKTYLINREDGAFVYCIDPFVLVNLDNEYYEYNYNNNYFNLSDDVLNRMNVIAYYGYGYGNHTELKWYGITQFLIWNEMELDELYFSTAKGERLNIYESEINELTNLVNNYYKMPSFSNESFKYTINNTYEIIDTNSVLSNYKVKDSNIDYRIDNNTIYIDTKERGNYEITFIKKSPIDREYLLYALNGNQSLLYPGKINDIEFKINIEVTSGSITVNKMDSENEIRQFASLGGAVYGVFNEDTLINEITTNEFGTGYIDDLPLGKYFIKELIPSIGYNLDEKVYEVELTYDNRNISIESLENIIKGDIELNKYYGEENNYELENNAVFDIYDINDNFIGSYETVNGKINEKLDYGEYYVVQKTGIDGYNFVDKFNISIKENKKYSFDLYDKALIVEVPNTGVYSYKYKVYPAFLILFGTILIFVSKKTTHQ